MLFDLGVDSWETKFLAGRYKIPVKVSKEGSRLFLKFAYNKSLLEEVKAFEGAKWHGKEEFNPRKEWSVTDSRRNRFQLLFLENPESTNPRNPYNRYDIPLIKFNHRTSEFVHQVEMIEHGLTRRQCIISAEMGTGKTLAAFKIMDYSGMHDWIYVGPKNALVSVKLEMRKWKPNIHPVFVTYEGLKKLLENWPEGKRAPQGVIFDEASRCKTPSSQRTQASRFLADSIREEWGDNGFVILMSGTPAPKSPADWWSLCEIACPGFLREGSIDKFKQRLAIIVQAESLPGGGAYPRLIGWRDDEKKCNICGQPQETECHAGIVDVFAKDPYCHTFVPSVNEVAKLYKRMAGLVKVWFKKDCLDLPDKLYREVIVKPTRSLLNAADAIRTRATSTIQALTLLRELSDGFQYTDQTIGNIICKLCHGNKSVSQPVPIGSEEEFELGHRLDGTQLPYELQNIACPGCSGTGFQDKIQRIPLEIPCPKDKALNDIIEDHDEIGRIVIYAGFTGSIDRIVKLVQKAQWSFIRVDGRGWFSDLPCKTPEDLTHAFQTEQTKHARVAFIGHPGSAGMGLTLTASPTTVYYSNDFNAESRIQSEDRIHRPGMDPNRGATIIDFIHLPTDKFVLDNLKRKRKLQDLTMGEMNSVIKIVESEILRDF